MSWRSWIPHAAWVLSACGRLGFSPLEEQAQIPTNQEGGSAIPGETCATAQRIAPQSDVIVKSTVGAREDVPASAGCGDGPEIVLRFSGSATSFPLRLEADFSGHYAIGQGCPSSASQTMLCGSFEAEQPTSLLSLDVTPDTYVILSNASGASGLVELWLGEAAP